MDRDGQWHTLGRKCQALRILRVHLDQAADDYRAAAGPDSDWGLQGSVACRSALCFPCSLSLCFMFYACITSNATYCTVLCETSIH